MNESLPKYHFVDFGDMGGRPARAVFFVGDIEGTTGGKIVDFETVSDGNGISTKVARLCEGGGRERYVNADELIPGLYWVDSTIGNPPEDNFSSGTYPHFGKHPVFLSPAGGQILRAAGYTVSPNSFLSTARDFMPEEMKDAAINKAPNFFPPVRIIETPEPLNERYERADFWPSPETLKAFGRIARKDAADAVGEEIVSTVHLHRLRFYENGDITAEYWAELDFDGGTEFMHELIYRVDCTAPAVVPAPFWVPGKTALGASGGIIKVPKMPEAGEVARAVRGKLEGGNFEDGSETIHAVTLDATGRVEVHLTACNALTGQWAALAVCVRDADIMPGEAYEPDCWDWLQYGREFPNER